jgi:hypothetical protein
MIIQIRGTSGSGKTWVMRRVMESLGGWTSYYQPGRQKPLYYGRRGVIVLGHYDSPCGGCDNIGSAAQVYELTKQMIDPDPSRVIVQEGLLLSEDSKWGRKLLEEGHDLRAVFLSTPLEECLGNIRRRREEAGNEKPLNEKNTANRVAVIERARVKLKEAGATCRRAPAAQAVRIVLGWVQAAR